MPSADEVKFKALYQAHARSVLGYALRRTTSPSDAADVVAETMLIAWRRIDVAPDEPETILWLYGVARNVVANTDRSQRRQTRLASKLASQLDDIVDDPQVADPQLAGAVAAAMRTLTTTEREVFTLTAAEQLSPAEIALVLDLKQNTVRTHLHRARKKLRSRLAIDAITNDASSAQRSDEAGHERAERSTPRFHPMKGAQS